MIKVGDTVRIVAPHPEHGAVGVVEQVFRANDAMERRARVRFDRPYPGSQIVGMRFLRVVFRDDHDHWGKPARYDELTESEKRALWGDR